MPEKLDLSGQTFGLLKVIKAVPPKNNRTHWKCVCTNCQEVRIVSTDSLRKGATRGCGSCLKIKHGMDGTPEYKRWSSIKDRCFNTNCKDYPSYGGRGITMQKDWINDFAKFHADILDHLGAKPHQFSSLDRIDNDGNYELGNLRWATRSMQQRNKKITKNKSSKYRGVYESNGQIRACIRDNDGNVLQLGTFSSHVEAARAYDQKAKELRGKDARPNLK